MVLDSQTDVRDDWFAAWDECNGEKLFRAIRLSLTSPKKYLLPTSSLDRSPRSHENTGQEAEFMNDTRPSIYLDHSATTPIWPEVVAIMQPLFSDIYGNPSSIHAVGRKAHASLQSARRDVARHIGAQEKEIVFTSGGSESDNAAVRGIALARREQCGAKRIISSAVEHKAILETLEDLEHIHNFEIVLLPVDATGRVNANDLAQTLNDDTALVSIMLANNEVGTIQPLAELGALCQAQGIPLHTDAVQGITKVPVQVDELGVAALSASAHKFHGPKGVGFLYLRQGTPFHPSLTGGGHEGGRRAGTENVPLICGLAKALDLNMAAGDETWERLTNLRNRLIAGVTETIEGAYLTGSVTHRLPHHASFIIPGLEAEAMLIGLDMAGIMASSGSACTSGAHQPSHVLAAMGITPPDSYGALRFSLGSHTQEEDIDFVLDQLARIIQQLRAALPAFA